MTKKKITEKAEKMQTRTSKLKWGNILVLVVVLGVLGYMTLYFFDDNSVDTTDDLSVYRGYTFTNIGDMWLFDYPYNGEVYSIPLRYHPTELTDIPVDKKGLNELQQKDTVYITVGKNLSSYATLGGVELAKIFGKAEYGVLQKDVRGAVPYEVANVLMITCANVSQTTGVISMELGSQNAVFYDNGCIVAVSENDKEMLRVASKIVYVTLGVMS